MVLFRLLLFSLQWAALTIAEGDGYAVCYGDNGICAVYLDITCPSINYTNPKPYYECYCKSKLAVNLACNICRFEYGLTNTVYDNYYDTKACSSHSISIGGIPTGVSSRVSSHTSSLGVTRLTTFDTSSYLSKQSILVTSKALDLPTPDPTTITYQLDDYITPIPTAPPSVESIGPENVAARKTLGITLFTGMLVMFGAVLILV